jgi:MFS family permease
VFTLFAVAAMLLCCAVLPVMCTRLAPPVPGPVQRMPLRRLYEKAPVAAAGAVLSGLASGAFWGLGPVYAEHAGLDKNGVAVFMTCTILGGALLQWPLGHYSDRRDRRRVLFSVALAAAAGALLMVLFTALGHGVQLAAFIYGGFAFAVYPVTVAHLIDHLAPEDILSGSSSLLLLNGVGSAIGPALAGVLMSAVGNFALPAYFAVVQLLLAGYALLRLRAVSDIGVGAPAHFVPMLRTTPAVLDMLPDAAQQEPD